MNAANINVPRYLPSRSRCYDDYYIPELGNVLNLTMIEVVVILDYFWTCGEWLRGLISDIYISMYVYRDIPGKDALFCRSCVLSGHFRCNSQKQQTGCPVVFVSD